MTDRHSEHPDAGAELFHAIELYPDGWPLFPGWDRQPVVRTKGMRRSPYRVVYFLRDGEPVILAYAHESQHPGYWKHRYDDMRPS